MYEEFLEGLLFWVKVLNEAEKLVGVNVDHDQVPYLGKIPVYLSDEIVGYLVDEIGGVWSYSPGA